MVCVDAMKAVWTNTWFFLSLTAYYAQLSRRLVNADSGDPDAVDPQRTVTPLANHGSGAVCARAG